LSKKFREAIDREGESPRFLQNLNLVRVTSTDERLSQNETRQRSPIAVVGNKQKNTYVIENGSKPSMINIHIKDCLNGTYLISTSLKSSWIVGQQRTKDLLSDLMLSPDGY
jgi:hypothetical protein